MTITRQPSRRPGFTRVDLLSVLAMLPLLALLLVGSGSITRSTAEAVTCLSNHRHVIRAWSEHAQDNRFLMNHSGPFASGWAQGELSWDVGTSTTNTAAVLTAEFRPYVGNDATVFRCPSDRFVSRVQLGRGWRHRVRTVSMNAHVGASRSQWGGNYPTYERLDDFTAPSETFVFAEEHPGSINDASFASDPVGARRPGRAQLIDIPASFHAQGGHFGFADGHPS